MMDDDKNERDRGIDISSSMILLLSFLSFIELSSLLGESSSLEYSSFSLLISGSISSKLSLISSDPSDSSDFLDSSN